MTETAEYVQGSLFEEDYLIRGSGILARSADVALTELVANAWDAGASVVDITIPESHGEKIIIKDDGIGLTLEEFHSRWMRLGYNRVKYQGDKVCFPEGIDGSRLAYGRNGIGRHGLLCFNDYYVVITTSGGKKSTFKISTRSESQPFVILEEFSEDCLGHGTRLEVEVIRNSPDSDRILEVISARFLHDPRFKVNINGESIPLEQHVGLIDEAILAINENITLKVLFIDTQKAARSSLYQGIAFWQGGRLVGEPSWMLGKNYVIDRRTRFAKQYTFVAMTDDLKNYVREDWTGFYPSDVMDEVYEKLSEYVTEVIGNIAKSHIEEIRSSIHEEFREKYKKLSPLGKYEVNEVIDHVVETHPTANTDTIGIAVEAVINLEDTRSGKALLQKLSHLSETDIDELNRLLDQWTIKDALCVLDEIDRRLSIIEAIDKLSRDADVEELKVLHPLVTEARWLFGPEYDSSAYISNSQLRTIAKKVFRIDSEKSVFLNEKKRPDLIYVKGFDSSISFTCTDEFDSKSDLVRVGRILIIELKRGGSNITRGDRDQAVHYVEDFIGCKELTGNPCIFAYVVGETISDKVVGKQKVGEEDEGQVFVITYGQLVDTARRRLFNLKDQLTERYEDVNGIDLADRARQLTINLDI